MISVQMENSQATQADWGPLRQVYAENASRMASLGMHDEAENQVRDDRAFRFYDV